MKHSLQLKLSQHLTLTPQLQQSIRLLQLSTLELNQEIETFLQENPLLERDDEEEAPTPPPLTTTTSTASTESEAPPSSGDNEPQGEPTAPESDWSVDDGYGSFSGQDGDEDGEAPQASVEPAKLRDHLLDQINLMQMPDRDKRIVAFLIDNLDDDGYMTQDLAELSALLPAELEIDAEQLTIGLKYLQSLDPPGIGART
jgi:RNA polymerase sigma-54 factor